MPMPYTFNTENLTPDEYHQLILNSPEWFLLHCRAGGYQFEIVNDNLKITPVHAIDDGMIALLKQQKPELIKILESEKT